MLTPAEPWTEAGDDRRLGNSPDDRTWGALRNLRQREVEVRRRAIVAIRERPDPSVIGHVVSLLRDPDTEVRALTATALGVLDEPRRTAFIGRALLDADEGVRHAADEAARACGISVDLARKEAVAPALDPPTKGAGGGSTEKDLFSPIAAVRKAAVEVLADTAAEESIVWLSKAAADPDSTVRAIAAAALGGQLKRTPLAAMPLGLLMSDVCSTVTYAAIKAAGSTSGDPLVERLEAMSGDPSHLYSCMSSLAALNSEKAQRALIRLTNHPDEQVRAQAAHTLSEVKPVYVIAELRDAVSHVDSKVASAAAVALARLSLDVALPTLTAAFREKPSVRSAVLHSFQFRKDKALLKLFLAGLRDRDPHVRRQAAYTLRERNEPEGRAGLIVAARRGDGSSARSTTFAATFT